MEVSSAARVPRGAWVNLNLIGSRRIILSDPA